MRQERVETHMIIEVKIQNGMSDDLLDPFRWRRLAGKSLEFFVPEVGNTFLDNDRLSPTDGGFAGRHQAHRARLVGSQHAIKRPSSGQTKNGRGNRRAV